MRSVLGTDASRFESEVAYHARVMQLADIESPNLSSYPFESDREYQCRRDGVLTGKAVRLKIWRMKVRIFPVLPVGS
jgi:hypothetical protein